MKTPHSTTPPGCPPQRRPQLDRQHSKGPSLRGFKPTQDRCCHDGNGARRLAGLAQLLGNIIEAGSFFLKNTHTHKLPAEVIYIQAELRAKRSIEMHRSRQKNVSLSKREGRAGAARSSRQQEKNQARARLCFPALLCCNAATNVQTRGSPPRYAGQPLSLCSVTTAPLAPAGPSAVGSGGKRFRVTAHLG